MIGSGIFVSPSGLLIRTGSVGMSFLIWVACGFLSLLGALAYAELGTMNTSSGAEYAYFMDAFGPMPAFLFSWVSTLVLKPSQMAIICLSFAKYAVEAFVTECDPPEIAVKVVSVMAIVIILFINCYSVNLATGVQNVFTAAKLVAILIVILGGLYKLIQGNTQHLENVFHGSTFSFGNIATAFYTGLWAYDGWNNLNYVTEEIKNPSTNLPRSIIIAIPLVTMCYVLINISYLAVMSAAEMIESEAVAVTFGNRILGVMAWLIPLSVTVSTFGSANGTLFAAGRLCFAASREGHLMNILSYVHVRRFTPAPGLIFHSIIAIAMVLSGTIDSLIDFFSFTAWIFYGGAMLALIVMRFTKPDHPRPYKVPIIIPVVVLVISLYLIVAPIIDVPQIEYLYAALFIVGGLIFYIPFVHYGVRCKIMGNHFLSL
ncbi:amino acid transporter, putative [Pediculus humanus corporis]|uniref:b(0,+)-type amino acid transporter 1 n=1 Tax=Pediculus humanus subsp. corporis TaxID=121224 RepID=E0VHK7_PEDHC|nr:amino acid transporter, putative [Pediculus humanus corporis]EEB12893.1 amino acid transporter, putative [Pediculus humanus corporis]